MCTADSLAIVSIYCWHFDRLSNGKSREHNSVFKDSHALYFASSSLCKQMSTFTGNSDVAVASACIICVPIYYNEKFAAALTRCANTNTRSFSKSSPKLQINKSNNKMKTWSQKHDTISCGWTNTSPAPAPPPSAALCPESAWSSSGWNFCSFMALCGSSLTPQWQLCMVH